MFLTFSVGLSSVCVLKHLLLQLYLLLILGEPASLGEDSQVFSAAEDTREEGEPVCRGSRVCVLVSLYFR